MDSRPHASDSLSEAHHQMMRNAHRRMVIGVSLVVFALPAPVLGGIFFGQEGFVYGCATPLVLLVLAAAHYGGHLTRWR